MTNISLGKKGENWAEEFLKKHGYKIIEKNFYTPFGQIDIIALDNNILCFIEVKTRRSVYFGFPEEAVSFTKQRKIIKVASLYLKEKRILDTKVRFDVISIVCRDDDYRIKLIRNAFGWDS
ncbi:MAG: YraN family protein [Candidatus Omnitrophica bacterium]|nr:YraN family protein [Candidatus Omnitrophota bacterium]